MKILWTILTLLLPQTVFARLHETKEQCIVRYGKPLWDESNDSFDGKHYFNTEHFHITIVFEKRKGESRCCYIEYMKRQEFGISGAEIEKLLSANKPQDAGSLSWRGPYRLTDCNHLAYGWYHKETAAWYNKNRIGCLIIESTENPNRKTKTPSNTTKGL